MIRRRSVVPGSTVLLALAVVAGACGSPAPSTPPSSAAPAATSAPASATASEAPPATTAPTAVPAATATPAPTTVPGPTATPAPAVDAAAAFASVISDPLFTAAITFEGSGSLGETVTATTGTLDIGTVASHLVRTVVVGKSSTKVDMVFEKAHRYVAAGDLWFDGGTSLGDALERVVTARGEATETGLEPVGGTPLHHLTLAPSDQLAPAVGATAKGITGFAGTIEAWVQDDGTPVRMRLAGEWDQPAGKSTVHGSRTVDLAFEQVGDDISVDVPDQLWTWVNSKKYKYRMARPSDWQYEPAHKSFIDGIWGYNGTLVFAERFAAHGYSLNTIVTFVTRGNKVGRYDAKLTSNKPGKLGGMPARILTYFGKVKKDHYWWVSYIAVKGGWVYWMGIRTEHKTAPTDRATVAQFASTFSLR